MNRVPVSVIVAIYNAEKTLPRLLDSLLAQTLQDFEVLMIDDGSTDGSSSICDRYSESDKRFKAFHKPNEGIGTTRQFGIEHAIGDYTIHADADDWVEPDYLELLYQVAISSGADMVVSDIFEEYGKRTVYSKQEPSSLDSVGFLNDLFYKLQGGPCNKLLKRSVYQERGIKYKEGIDYGEDKLFNLQLVMTGIKISYCPKPLYHYDMVINPDSAIHGYTLQKIEKREPYITALRELLPNDFQTGIDNRHLDVVYMAIKSKAFKKSVFTERYSYLSRVRWKDYTDKAFSVKVVIWTSLHISYRLALLFSDVKKVIRRFRQHLDS